MKILVTGCAGFIGYHLCNILLQNQKYKVHGIDDLNSYYDVNLKKKRLRLLRTNNNFFFHKLDIKNIWVLKIEADLPDNFAVELLNKIKEEDE